MKKLTGNGLWESSRMMLFEHRDAILAKQEQQHIREQPLLDEQQAEWIAEKLSHAYSSKRTVRLRVFGQYSDDTVSGIISKMDVLRRRIYIQDTWISLTDILEADAAGEEDFA